MQRNQKESTARFSHTPNATVVARLPLGAGRITLRFIRIPAGGRITRSITIDCGKIKITHEIAYHNKTQMKTGKK